MQTPGRVHALCKLLAHGSQTQDRLMELLQPNSDRAQVKEVYRLALNGGLVKLGEDKKVHLQVPEQIVFDRKEFQNYVSQLAFNNNDFVFGKFTAWVMTRGEKVLNETKDQLSDSFFNDVTRQYTKNREFNDTNINGWVTWANYFGLGHTMNGKFIVNPANRIQTELENDKQALPSGEMIPFRTFMKWLGEKCPELDGGNLNRPFNTQYSSQQLSFALSLALSTLHDMKIISLQNTRDIEDIWYLSDMSTHHIPNQVTEIMVLKG